MIFLEMQESDLEQIVELEKVCFSSPWMINDLKKELEENPFSHGWVLKDDEIIVGYAFLWETFEMAQIARIGVDFKYRKKGYGKSLMENLLERARSQACEFMTLEVRTSNIAAIKMYEKFDFVQVNVSKGYYPDGEDAIVMTRAL